MIKNLNFQGGDWNAIRKQLELEIEILREKNDSSDLTVEQTAAIRGEIRALKKILWWPESVKLDNQMLPSD